MPFSVQDQQFMQLALDLARNGRFTTSPNPAVGCVLVKEGEIVGQGFHSKAGEPHAEIMALRVAGEKAQGATAYVTLEPCSHFGRTPPCAKGLIEAGVRKVIAAMQDPNPQVAGKGLQMLEQAGIEAQVGLLATEAEQLNQGFLHRMRTQKPYVQLKMAMSLDGRTAMASGESQWITSTASRTDVQQERALACAILSTSKTVLADNPSLNVRWQQLPEPIQKIYPEDQLRQPIRIILDSKHQLTPELKLFSIPSPIWLVSDKPRDMSVFPAFCEQLVLSPQTTESLLQTLIFELGKRQINRLWVEAGANLAGSLIEQQLADELILYVAPKLLGDQARGLCHLPSVQNLAQAPHWQLQQFEVIGEDLKLRYKKG